MSDLTALSDQQLVDSFADLSHRQGTALEDEDTNQYTRLYNDLRAVVSELRRRGPDARKALVPLLEKDQSPAWSYQSAQTRFNAAVELKAVVPELARATLESLASKGPHKYRGMAGMSLSFDDRGISKPT